MRTFPALALSLVAAAINAPSQPAPAVQFEAASVKRLAPDSNVAYSCTGGLISPNPVRFSCTKVPFRMLVWLAYNTPYYQVVGPAWADTEMYQVIATLPANTPREQFLLMFQNLLKERFHLVVHREPRPARIYALRAASGGTKLTPSADAPETDKADDPVNMKTTEFQSYRHLAARKQSMKVFARYLSIPTKTKVLDETEILGTFDFTLDYSRTVNLSADPSAEETSRDAVPNIFLAIKSLGLRLEPVKGELDTLVIDSADRTPVEN